jgi:hypothetical protein
MLSKRFHDAMKDLKPKEASVIRAQLDSWKAESFPSPWSQIAVNIENETALSRDRFARLLGEFSRALGRHSDPGIAWRETCKSHLFHGNVLAGSDRPMKLGRASKFDMFLRYARTTDKRFKDMLAKYAGKKPPTFLKNTLAKQDLGGSVIFATFNESDTSDDPFANLPRDRESIRTALGLGHPSHASPDPYLLFTYTGAEPPELPIHRPTISDAGDFPHFRPVKSSTAKWGLTGPLSPNPDNLPPRPEVVHKQIVGDRLVFPYEITIP